MIYLETNAIRVIGKNLKRYVSTTKVEVKTSGLVIFELIAGLDEAEYRIRKSALGNILDSKILIDWRLPTEIFGNAFGIYELAIKKSVELSRTYDAIIRSRTFSESIEASTKDGFWDIESIKIIEKKMNDDNKRRFDQNIEKYREYKKGNDDEKVLAKCWRKMDSELSVSEKEIVGKLITESIEAHKRLLAMDICNSVGIKNQEEFEELVSHYDNSINEYLLGIALFQITKLYNLESLGGNDFFDISHLIYLSNNENNRIMSSDMVFDRIYCHSYETRRIPIFVQ